MIFPPQKHLISALTAGFLPIIGAPFLKAQDYLNYLPYGTTTPLANTGDVFSYNAAFATSSNPAFAGPVLVSGIYTETVTAGSLGVTPSPISLQIQGGPDDTSISSSDLYADVIFDFSHLAGGALPAIAGFGLLDVDGSMTAGGVMTATTLENLTAYDASGVKITVPWLTNITTFDFNALPPDGQPEPSGPSDYPTVNMTGPGVYSITGATTMTDSPLFTASFSQAISRIEYRHFAPKLSSTNTFFSVPQVVPEPGAAGLGLLAFTGFFLRRR